MELGMVQLRGNGEEGSSCDWGGKEEKKASQLAGTFSYMYSHPPSLLPLAPAVRWLVISFLARTTACRGE